MCWSRHTNNLSSYFPLWITGSHKSVCQTCWKFQHADVPRFYPSIQGTALEKCWSWGSLVWQLSDQYTVLVWHLTSSVCCSFVLMHESNFFCPGAKVLVTCLRMLNPKDKFRFLILLLSSSAIIENMAEFRPGLCTEAAQQGLMQWLLKRIKVRKWQNVGQS